MKFYKIKAYETMKDYTLDTPQMEWFKEFRSERAAYVYGVARSMQEGLHYTDVELVK